MSLWARAKSDGSSDGRSGGKGVPLPGACRVGRGSAGTLSKTRSGRSNCSQWTPHPGRLCQVGFVRAFRVLERHMVCFFFRYAVVLPAPPVRAVSSRCGALTTPPPAAAATIGPATPTINPTQTLVRNYGPRHQEMQARRSCSSLWKPGGLSLLQSAPKDDGKSVTCGG